MLSINPLITLVVVVLSPMSFFIANFISKKTFIMFKKQSEARGELTGLTNEMLEGIKVVQAFGHEEETQKQFKEINERLANYSLRATFFSSITNPATRFMYSCIYAGVAISGCFGVINGMLSVGQLSSFLSYTNQYTKPFNEITSVITEFQNSLASAARVFELIDEKPISDDKADSAVLDSPKGEISLEQVDFSYTPEVPLIQGLNLHANPGQRIAIVGPTGCGKQTLINLLMRFYEINSGSIKIDGHDIDSITRHSLRASYGMVLQELHVLLKTHIRRWEICREPQKNYTESASIVIRYRMQFMIKQYLDFRWNIMVRKICQMKRMIVYMKVKPIC